MDLEIAIDKSLQFLERPLFRKLLQRCAASATPSPMIRSSHRSRRYPDHDAPEHHTRPVQRPKSWHATMSTPPLATTTRVTCGSPDTSRRFTTARAPAPPNTNIQFIRAPAICIPMNFTGQIQWHLSHPPRTDLATGKLRGQELLWFKKPIEPFLIQVQGSAQVILPNNETVYVGFAGVARSLRGHQPGVRITARRKASSMIAPFHSPLSLPISISTPTCSNHMSSRTTA